MDSKPNHYSLNACVKEIGKNSHTGTPLEMGIYPGSAGVKPDPGEAGVTCKLPSVPTMAEVEDCSSSSPNPSAPSNPSQNDALPTNRSNTIFPTAPQPLEERLSKKRRIRFNTSLDILLLKSVVAVDAHMPPHGESQMRFEEALDVFKSMLPSQFFDRHAQPVWKSLYDRFNKVLREHRQASEINRRASGIIEVRGERETLLDDIMLAVDEFDEQRRTEKDERTELDERLKAAGQEIREQALSRIRTEGDQDGVAATSDQTQNGTPNASSSRKRSISLDSDEEDKQLLSDHITSRKLFEEKRLKIEERRLEFDMQREDRDASRQDALQLNETRRIAVEEKKVELEEQRIELEKEERKGAIAERREVLAVLGALVNKLT